MDKDGFIALYLMLAAVFIKTPIHTSTADIITAIVLVAVSVVFFIITVRGGKSC